MPISPRPPSGANTNSLSSLIRCGLSSAIRAARQLRRQARYRRIRPSRVRIAVAQQQPAARRRAPRTGPRARRARWRRGSGSPRPAATASQRARIVGESRAPRAQAASASSKRAARRSNRRSPARRRAERVGSRIGVGIGKTLGRRDAIDADADDARRSARPAASRPRPAGPRAWRRRQTRSFGHLSATPRRRDRATARRSATPATKPSLRRERGVAGVDEQRARVEIAGRRTPAPALPAAPRGLLVGDDPEPARDRPPARVPRARRWSSRALA